MSCKIDEKEVGRVKVRGKTKYEENSLDGAAEYILFQGHFVSLLIVADHFFASHRGRLGDVISRRPPTSFSLVRHSILQCHLNVGFAIFIF